VEVLPRFEVLVIWKIISLSNLMTKKQSVSAFKFCLYIANVM